MSALDQLNLSQIRQCLQQQSEATHDNPFEWAEKDCKQAAVLIPFVKHQNEWQLLFIRRAIHDDDHHSGQVAFAGGKYEQGDVDLQATALREAEEEIGLHPHDVTVLGQLNFHHSISRFKITPVVAYLSWPYELKLDQQEVASAFTIPLSWLADPSNHRLKQRKLAGNKHFPVVYFDEYKGELLWGATARMTLSLISLLAV